MTFTRTTHGFPKVGKVDIKWMWGKGDRERERNMDTDGRCSRHEIGSPYSILMVVICAVRIWLLVFLATRLVIRSSSLLLSSSLRNSWGSRRIVSHTLHKGIEQQHLATTPTEQWMAHKNVSEVFACFGPLAFLSRPLPFSIHPQYLRQLLVIPLHWMET